MKAQVVTITPEKTKALLEINSNNRTLTDSTVRRYVEDMREGRWGVTGSPIQIGEAPTLTRCRSRSRGGTMTTERDGLTVAELIEALGAYPPDAPVMVDGYEGGLHTLGTRQVYAQEVRLDFYPEGEWWYGPHEPIDQFSSAREKEGERIEAVVLSRGGPNAWAETRSPHAAS